MEPLSIGIISGIASGAAGQVVVKAWDSGEKWLSTYFKDHHPKAIEKARQNSLEFLADLAHRIHQLEDAAGSSEMIKDRIVSALEDPAFSALLKDALVESATTESKNSHRLLARLVAERLRCESDDLLALTIPLASEAVKPLTNNQFREFIYLDQARLGVLS